MSVESLISYFAGQGPVILLESQSSDHPWSGKSFLAAQPKSMIKAWGNKISVMQGDREKSWKENPWQALQAFRQRKEGWLFGYLGYDLKNHVENLRSLNDDSIKAPDMYFMEPGFLLEFDQKTGESWVLKGQMPDDVMVDSCDPVQPNYFELGAVNSQTDRTCYLENIRKAQQKISEGEFYEINLSHQLKSKFSGSPVGLYKRMKEVGPVPFGAYLQDDDLAICCQSPERFLRKEGTTVFSQPIKGTARRSTDYTEDELLKEQLMTSPKERAENLMIVDLVRNDLSKISCHGSVKVPALFEIETFDTVHQMVSTVKAEARETDPITILKACFPMGSMTGAPKIRTMQTIEQLEDYRRGIYSGAIGYIDPQDNFDFNVVIRTAIIRGDELFYSVGGAITGDSKPADEWTETMVKARALFDTRKNLPSQG